MAVNASSFEDEKPGGIQVIARAAAILNVLGKHPGGMSLGEIAQEVALPRSTVQRIVAALDSAQLVRSSGAGGLRLGPALLKLISSVHSDVVDLVRPFLEQLSANVNETLEGVCTIAVALDTLLGRFSISLLVPAARFHKHEAFYRKELMQCKEGIVNEIGRITTVEE